MRNPPLYCCSLPTSPDPPQPLPATVPLQFNRLAVFDIELKAWTIVDLPYSIYGMNDIRTAFGFVRDWSLWGGQTDGILRLWLDAPFWDKDVTNIPISWSVMLPDVFQDGSGRMFFQDILIRGNVIAGPVKISSQLYAESKSQAVLPVQTWSFGVPGDFELRVPIGQAHTSMRLVLSGTGRVSIDGVKWSVAPLEARVPASLMVG
jgi:hypothetical protein